MKTDKPRTMRRLLGYVGRHKAALADVFVFALIGNTSLLLAPKLIGRAIDLILPGTGGGYLAALLKTLAVIGVLYLAGSLFNWLTALCANLVANRTVRALRVDLFGKLGRLPLQYYDTHSHGDMMSRFTNDIDAISDGLNQGIVQLVSGVMTVLLSLAFMLSLNPMVTLVAVFVTPLCFLVGFAITKYGSRRFKEQSRTLGRLNGYAEELISGQRTVKAFGYEDRAVDGFDAINAELYQCGYRAQFASALVNPSTRFVNNVAYVLVGVFGILAVLKNALTPGGVASFLTYTAQFSKPFNEITAITMQLQLAMASARRVFAVLDGEEQRPEPADAARLEAAEGSVAFEHVRFAYQPERPLITDFNLTVKPGMTVAIVGPTGAGKTTALNQLEALGGCVLDADAVYRTLCAENREMLSALDTTFGGVTDANGVLDRPKLAKIVFSDPAKLQTLNEITTPYIRRASLDVIHAQSECPVVLYDAPTLFEAGADDFCGGSLQHLGFRSGAHLPVPLHLPSGGRRAVRGGCS